MVLGAIQGQLGLTWSAAVAGALAALFGVATGRRALALPGALLVAALCALDGLRDLSGDGSRWMALFVNVLPALLPAALVLAVAAARPRRHGLRATAWTFAATAALILIALAIEEHTTTGTTVLAAGFALAALAFASGHTACLVAAPAAAWSILAAAPSPQPALLVLTAATLVSAIRLSGHTRRTRAQ